MSDDIDGYYKEVLFANGLLRAENEKLRAALRSPALPSEGDIARAWNDARASLCVTKSTNGTGAVYGAGKDWPVGDPQNDRVFFKGGYAEVDAWVDAFCARAVRALLGRSKGYT
jgi:hypothetical protein